MAQHTAHLLLQPTTSITQVSIVSQEKACNFPSVSTCSVQLPGWVQCPIAAVLKNILSNPNSCKKNLVLHHYATRQCWACHAASWQTADYGHVFCPVGTQISNNFSYESSCSLGTLIHCVGPVILGKVKFSYKPTTVCKMLSIL